MGPWKRSLPSNQILTESVNYNESYVSETKHQIFRRPSDVRKDTVFANTARGGRPATRYLVVVIITIITIIIILIIKYPAAAIAR